ncbi:MAG: hypothetical protein ACRDKG_16035 [Actinomycetota bacterium]
MWKRLRSIKLSTAAIEWAVAGAVGSTVLCLAVAGAWVFSGRSGLRTTDSVWSEFLADRVTLGVLRALLAASALYALASIAVLVSKRRWLRSFSASGIGIDATSTSDDALAAAERELRQARAERDEARRLAWRLHGG